MMKRKYFQPFAEISVMNTGDVLTVSGADLKAEYDDLGEAPENWF